MYFCRSPMLMPANASVDVIEISIPAVSMTQSMPSAMINVRVLLRNICLILVNERNDGLIIPTTIRRTASTITRLASLDSDRNCPIDFFFIMPHLLSLNHFFPLKAPVSSPATLPISAGSLIPFRCTLRRSCRTCLLSRASPRIS